jgi:hypothetical protein
MRALLDSAADAVDGILPFAAVGAALAIATAVCGTVG